MPRQTRATVRNENQSEEERDWAKYVSSNTGSRIRAESASLEMSYQMKYGLIRMDSENVAQFHGQQDAYFKDEDTSAFEKHPSVEINTDFTSNMSPIQPNIKKDFENDSFLEKPPDDRWSIKPQHILASNHSLVSHKQPALEKLSDLEDVKVKKANSSLTDSDSDLNDIDRQFFGSLKDIQVSKSESSMSCQSQTKGNDEMNEIDEQFFGSLRNIESNSLGPTADELKPVQAPDSDLNFIDQQMFGQGPSQELPTKSKEWKKKAGSAMDYIRKNYADMEPTTYSDLKPPKINKNKGIDMLNHGIQKRLFNVATKEEKQSAKENEMNQSDPSYTPTSPGEKSGIPSPKYLPVVLNKLSSAEVQDIFNRGVVFNESKLFFKLTI